MEPVRKNNMTLEEMLITLREIDAQTWGAYAFSGDMLKDRVPEELKHEMIVRAMQCGQEYADRIVCETGQMTPLDIAQQLGLRVLSGSLPGTEARVVFAQFTPPNQIEIMEPPIEKYLNIMASTHALVSDIETQKIRDMLLGHEIFHFLEDRDSETIYTRTEKICLWRFLGFQNTTTIHVLGEIAAMAFTQKLNQSTDSPFLLNVLLSFGYQGGNAQKIYWDVINLWRQRLAQRKQADKRQGRMEI